MTTTIHSIPSKIREKIIQRRKSEEDLPQTYLCKETAQGFIFRNKEYDSIESRFQEGMLNKQIRNM